MDITWNGETKSQIKWARSLGISTQGLKTRLQKWPLERALSTMSRSRNIEIPDEERRQRMRDYLNRRKLVTSTGCWEVATNKAKNRYTTLTFLGHAYTAHRLSAFAFIGFDLEDKAFICHICDNKHCFNPEHLYIGDRSTNTRDAVARNRIAKGMRNAQAKLTDEQIAEIRELYAAGQTQAEIAKKFGVDRTNVGVIVSGKSWKSLPAVQRSKEFSDYMKRLSAALKNAGINPPKDMRDIDAIVVSIKKSEYQLKMMGK